MRHGGTGGQQRAIRKGRLRSHREGIPALVPGAARGEGTRRCEGRNRRQPQGARRPVPGAVGVGMPVAPGLAGRGVVLMSVGGLRPHW